MALSLVNANTFNAYTGAFQVLAFANMWRRLKSASAALRIIPFLCVMAAGAAVAVLGYRSFVTNLTNFLDVLLVIFIPWSAVNLTDYFVIRRARYDVASFFSPRHLRQCRLARTARIRGGLAPNGRSSPSPITPGRSSGPSAVPTSHGSSASSSRRSSSWSW